MQPGVPGWLSPGARRSRSPGRELEPRTGRGAHFQVSKSRERAAERSRGARSAEPAKLDPRPLRSRPASGRFALKPEGRTPPPASPGEPCGLASPPGAPENPGCPASPAHRGQRCHGRTRASCVSLRAEELPVRLGAAGTPSGTRASPSAVLARSRRGLPPTPPRRGPGARCRPPSPTGHARSCRAHRRGSRSPQRRLRHSEEAELLSSPAAGPRSSTWSPAHARPRPQLSLRGGAGQGGGPPGGGARPACGSGWSSGGLDQ